MKKKVSIEPRAMVIEIDVEKGMNKNLMLEKAKEKMFEQLKVGKASLEVKSYSISDADTLSVKECKEGFVVSHEDFDCLGVIYKINKKSVSVRFKNGQDYNIGGGLKHVTDYKLEEVVNKERIEEAKEGLMRSYLKREGNIFILNDKGEDITLVLGKVSKVNTKAYPLDNPNNIVYKLKSHTLDAILKEPFSKED